MDFITKAKSSRYHSKRPFLMIAISHHPVKGVNTSVKGWGSEPNNWDTRESITVVDRVNKKHLTDYAVIIDILNGTAVKNRFIDTDTKIVVEHYLKKYKQEAVEATDIWISRANAQNSMETV